MGYTRRYLSYGVQVTERRKSISRSKAKRRTVKVFNQFEFYQCDDCFDKYRYQVTKNGAVFAQSDSCQTLLDIVAADDGKSRIETCGYYLIGSN